MMQELKIHLFGGVEIALNDVPLGSFLSAKAPALLAYLAVTGRPHRREALAGLLWGDLPEAAAANNLRQVLTNLRKSLDPFLLVTRETVELNPAQSCRLDVAEFQALLAPASGLAPAERMRRLQAAADLYRGDFLAGFYVREAIDFEEWMLAQRVRYRELALNARHTLAQRHLEAGEYDAAIHAAAALLALDPWREEAHCQLMLALARTGQRTAALGQYETCKKILQKELGVEPSLETTALYEKIRAARQGSRHNIPASSTEFIGREKELANLRQRLADPACRLVTLTGLGGVGKTRLAQETARACADRFINGAWMIPLAALEANPTVNTFFYALAAALPITLSGADGPKTQLGKFFQAHELLLVLDNLEHLLDFADILVEFLQLAPDLKILVTSRERLNLQIEWIVDLGGLQPDSALQFFEQRARRVNAAFALTERESPIVRQICRMVDGLPLGLELASAWARTMDCASIAEEIARSLDFLATSQRDIPERQRSLRAVFDSSWTRLTKEEQNAFLRLSTFLGGFTLPAAQAVAECPPSLLASLTDRSFVQHDLEGRYSIHEVLRQYADEKLRAAPQDFTETQDKHSVYYTGWLAQVEPSLAGAGQAETLQQISADLDNVRKAWNRAMENRDGAALSAAAQALYDFYRIRGFFQEGLEFFHRASESLPSPGQDRSGPAANDLFKGRLLARGGKFHILLGSYRQALAPLQQSLDIFRRLGEEAETAFALDQLGAAAWLTGDSEQARDLLGEAVEIRRRLNDQSALANSLLSLCGALYMVGDFEAMSEMAQSGLQLAETLGNRRLAAHFNVSLANVAYIQGAYAASRRQLAQSLAVYEEIADKESQALALHLLSRATLALGKATEAEKLSRESLIHRREIGNKGGMVETLTMSGRIACATGRIQDAKEFYHEALAVAVNIQSEPVFAYVFIGLAELLRKEGKDVQAAEMLAFASRYSSFPDAHAEAVRLRREIEASLQPGAWKFAQETGRRLHLEQVVEQW